MTNLITRLFPKLFGKKEIKLIEPETLSPKAHLAKELRESAAKQNGFSHDQIVLIAAVWFNLDMSARFYKLRRHTKYGQYFGIKSVGVIWGEQPNKIKDVVFTMHDAAYETDFMLSVSIRCFDEWLEPVRWNGKPTPGQPEVKIG